MYDASSKYPDGILYGNTRHLGNFDECYNLHVNIRREQNGYSEITGRYCLVDLHYKRKTTSSNSDKSVVSEVDPESSFWDVIEVYVINIYAAENNFTKVNLGDTTHRSKELF